MQINNQNNYLALVPEIHTLPNAQDASQLTVDSLLEILNTLSIQGFGDLFVLFQDHSHFYAVPASSDHIICSTDMEGFPIEGSDCVLFG